MGGAEIDSRGLRLGLGIKVLSVVKVRFQMRFCDFAAVPVTTLQTLQIKSNCICHKRRTGVGRPYREMLTYNTLTNKAVTKKSYRYE